MERICKKIKEDTRGYIIGIPEEKRKNNKY